MMLREPAVAGSFYAGAPMDLSEQVRSMLNPKAEKRNVRAAVVPHAGLMYSGMVAGEVYSRIKMPDTLVMIGPNHYGAGPEFSIMTEGVWVTPLGETHVDSYVAREIYSRCGRLTEDQLSQRREHSLEVQLPFIQYLSPKTQIVPISMRHYLPDPTFLRICEETGEAIADALSAVKSSAAVVASTDFTHYEVSEKARKNDRAALDAIIALDAGRLFTEVDRLGISMCGYAAVAVAISAARKMGAKKGELIRYMTSGDTTGDNSSVVGYGGLILV